MSTNLELAGCQRGVVGPSQGEDLPGTEAVVMETRIKSGERRRPENIAEPSLLPQHLQLPDPINSLLELKLVCVGFLSLATKTSNSWLGSSDPNVGLLTHGACGPIPFAISHASCILHSPRCHRIPGAGHPPPSPPHPQMAESQAYAPRHPHVHCFHGKS